MKKSIVALLLATLLLTVLVGPGPAPAQTMPMTMSEQLNHLRSLKGRDFDV